MSTGSLARSYSASDLRKPLVLDDALKQLGQREDSVDDQRVSSLLHITNGPPHVNDEAGKDVQRESCLFSCLRDANQDKEINPWQWNKGVRIFVGIVSGIYVVCYYFAATSGNDKLTKEGLSLPFAMFCGGVTSLIRGPFMMDALIKFLPNTNISKKQLALIIANFLLSLPAAFAFKPTGERGLELCKEEFSGCNFSDGVNGFIVYYLVVLRVVSIALSAMGAPKKLMDMFKAAEPRGEQLLDIQTLEELRYNLEKWINQFPEEKGSGYKVMGGVCLTFNGVQAISSYANTAKGSALLLYHISGAEMAPIHVLTSFGIMSLTLFQFVGTWKGCNVAYAVRPQ